MKKHLSYLSLLFYCIFLTSLANAQTDQFAYAVTDINKEGANWSFLRKIDLNTGSFSNVILNGTDDKQLAYDHDTKKQFSESVQDARFNKAVNTAFATGVAAIAYDKKSQRIYYTPMFINQLRYVDLKTMKVYFVATLDIASLKTKAADQSNIITRMAIADDGNGYALTNDGNHLLQFTTGKKITITDLGAVTDDSQNKVSVHNSPGSYGGDMIADDEGNLYLFSNQTNVFKINIQNKTAIHLGTISGLPSTFTVNGAAVDNNNQVLVTSAVDNNNNIFSVDSKTWTATPLNVGSGSWRTADLANSNLLATRKDVPLLTNPNSLEDGRVQLYPNPVVNNKFNLQFNLAEGTYTVQIKDVSGRQITQTVTNINGKGQTKALSLPAGSSKGFYIVEVIDQNNKTVYNKKILVH